MYLMSTAKSTVLTEFENLETKSIYHHANNENRDFQFYNQQRIFVEVNKQSGLEVMRIKETNNQKCDIQRVRKLTIDSVYCVACTKQSVEEMAVGLSNGQVKLYNYNNSEFVHKFPTDNRNNSVLFLDYNASDEYIAGVFESGCISIYGYKTKNKLETINVDNQSTLARFHPCKRFHLAVASYKGGVTLYDIQAKCKLFNATEAHIAPCRDLCMTPAAPDILISVGYDCLINVYDIRRKIKPVQLKYCHPLSTVAASECGTYFCVGNLKGELTTYDMRNLKDFIASKKIHDCAVTRVAFAPLSVDNNGSSLYTTAGVMTSESLNSAPCSTASTGERKSLGVKETELTPFKHRDSFGEFLDFQANRGQENSSPRFVPQRDSFDWEALNRKPVTDNSGGLSLLQQDFTDSKTNISTTDILKQPLKDRSNISFYKLTQIKEKEEEQHENKHTMQPLPELLITNRDKDNPPPPSTSTQIDLDFCLNNPLLPPDCKSTPSRQHSSITSATASLSVCKPQSSSTTNNTATSITSDAGCDKNLEQTDLIKAISTLREEMLERFRQLEFEVKFHVDRNKWQIFTQNSNLWNQQLDHTAEILDTLNVLLQTDPFVKEFLRLKEENQSLKQQLQEFMK